METPICKRHSLPMRTDNFHPLFGLCPLCVNEMSEDGFNELMERYWKASIIMQRAMVDPETRPYQENPPNDDPNLGPALGTGILKIHHPDGETDAQTYARDDKGVLYPVLAGGPESESPDRNVQTDGD